MIESRVYIDRSIEDVWAFIAMEFAKSFKCSPTQLLGKETEVETITYSGKPIRVKQRVSEVNPAESLILISENSRDIVTTAYYLEKDEEGGTFLTVREGGQGKGSVLRTLNYKVMSFPFFKKTTQRKLEIRLSHLKNHLEGETLNTEA